MQTVTSMSTAGTDAEFCNPAILETSSSIPKRESANGIGCLA